MEAELLRKQLAFTEEQLQEAQQQLQEAQHHIKGEDDSSLPAAEEAELTSEQRLRILMTCANTAERRVKQLEDELGRVSIPDTLSCRSELEHSGLNPV